MRILCPSKNELPSILESPFSLEQNKDKRMPRTAHQKRKHKVRTRDVKLARGSRAWKDEEHDKFLDAVKDIKPTGRKHWELVAEWHYMNGYNQTGKNLKRKKLIGTQRDPQGAQLSHMLLHMQKRIHVWL